MARAPASPGGLLRAFREMHGISIREAARQLHVVHPTYMDWESGRLTPSRPYREAIETWTEGVIKATAWPMSARERGSIENATKVRSFREHREQAELEAEPGADAKGAA